jgi:hypothetical protein
VFAVPRNIPGKRPLGKSGSSARCSPSCRLGENSRENAPGEKCHCSETCRLQRKREIFQCIRDFCLTFQCNREISTSSVNCPGKVKLHSLFAVIALFIRSYNGYFALSLKDFCRHDVLISRLH